MDDGTAPLTKTEQAAFLVAIRGTTYEPLFLTALNTGAWIGELLALAWEDINLDTCEIRNSKTLGYQKNQSTGKYENQIVTPKTKASNRIIPFSKFLMPYLQSLHNKELKKKMRLQNKYADLNLIFANRLGYYLLLGSIRTAMNKIQDEAGLRFKIHVYFDFDISLTIAIRGKMRDKVGNSKNIKRRKRPVYQGFRRSNNLTFQTFCGYGPWLLWHVLYRSDS